MNRSVFFLLGAFALSFAGCGKNPKSSGLSSAPPALPVVYFRLPAQTRFQYRVFPGVVQPETQVNLAFRQSGRLIVFTPGPGKAVRKGELLAKLDPVLLEAAADAARARYEEAKHDYDRSRILFEKHILAAADFEKKKRDYEVAEADCRNARDDLADSVIYAPFSGIVSNTWADNFQQVKANDVLIRLQDLSSFQVSVDVPEKEVARFPPGIAEANRLAAEAGGFYATMPSLPAARFPLVLKEASTQADPVSQTFTVTFRILPQKFARLLPGMTMSVHVPLLDASRQPGFQIPARAVFSSGGKNWVWRIGPDDRVEKTEVSMENISAGTVRITAPGLSPGDPIALTGILVLSDGARVCPLTPSGSRKLTGEIL